MIFKGTFWQLQQKHAIMHKYVNVLYKQVMDTSEALY